MATIDMNCVRLLKPEYSAQELGWRDTLILTGLLALQNGEYHTVSAWTRVTLEIVLGEETYTVTGSIEGGAPLVTGVARRFTAVFDWSDIASELAAALAENGRTASMTMKLYRTHTGGAFGTVKLACAVARQDISIRELTGTRVKRLADDSFAADDEGEALRLSVVASWPDGRDEDPVSVHLHYAPGRTVSEQDPFLDLTAHRDAVFGEGYTADIDSTVFPNGSDVRLLLVIEGTSGGVLTSRAQSTAVLPRAFANVHMSGAVTDGKQVGGVAFGRFSSVQDGDAQGRFECAYPAYFENGIFDGDGSPIGGIGIEAQETVIGTFLGKPLYRAVISRGGITTSTGAATVSLSGAVNGTIDTLVRLYGAVRLTGNLAGWLPLNTYHSSSIRSFARLGTGGIVCYCTAANNAAIFILEYTKV